MSGGYLKDDSVNRNASSVWDSFDGSTVLESWDSLQGESFGPCVVLGMISKIINVLRSSLTPLLDVILPN